MPYQALYRKYRPQSFAQVVGQDHITTILKNQISAKRIAHAYLFCGSRGTGKTSTAKIFARAINCFTPKDGDPCNECSHCKYSSQENVDIIEIDAASNTGVDDMRALLEKAQFTPLQLNTKVYIIDEVHMLTTNAFNALLKTLEEPPEHVVFILATTEPQKLPATIISRCQRFDFHRLTVDDIVHTLQRTFSELNIEMEAEGFHLIANAAEGGMRDAFTLADQCIAFSDGYISAADVAKVLGSMDQSFLFRAADLLIQSQSKDLLNLIDVVVRDGHDLGVFTQNLTQHIRALLLAKVCGSCADILECSPDTMQQYLQQAEKAPQPRLLRILNLLIETQAEMKWFMQARIILEAAVIKACLPETEASLTALEDRIAQLENKLKQFSSDSLIMAPAKNDSPVSIESDSSQRLAKETERPKRTVEKMIEKQDPLVQFASVPAKTSAESHSDNDASHTWARILASLQTRNISLYILAKEAKATALENSVLSLHFPANKPALEAGLRAPHNWEILASLCKEVNPDLTLFIESGELKNNSSNAAEDKVMRLFGDKLTIEE